MKPTALLATLMAAITAASGCVCAPAAPAPLPGGRHGHRVELVDGRFYLLGGYGGDSAAGVRVLDGGGGRWVDRAAMHVPKVFFASVVIDGAIYAIGGSDAKDGEEGAAVIERYDAGADRWDVLVRSERLPRSHLAAAAVGRRVYIIGGFPDTHVHVHEFDTKTGEFADAPPIPGFQCGDHFHYVAALGGRLHVLGGMRFGDKSGERREHWVLDDGRWIQRAPLPAPSMAKLAAYGVIGEKLYVFSPLHGLHHVYDPAADSWSDAPATMPVTLTMPACVTQCDRLHVFGGLDLRGRGDGAVHTYDATKNVWMNAR